MWFKVKGSKVKVTGYVTANTDSWQICFVSLLIYRVSVSSIRPARALHMVGGPDSSTWRLPGALRKTSENNIFKPNKPEKPRTSGVMSFGLRDAMLSQLHAF